MLREPVIGNSFYNGIKTGTEVESTVRIAGQAREIEAKEASDALEESSSVTLFSISSTRVKEGGEELENCKVGRAAEYNTAGVPSAGSSQT